MAQPRKPQEMAEPFSFDVTLKVTMTSEQLYSYRSYYGLGDASLAQVQHDVERRIEGAVTSERSSISHEDASVELKSY